MAVAVCALPLAAAAAPTSPLPGAPRCAVFPKDNPWNRRVDRLPVAPNSAAIVASIGLDEGLHPDFGSGLYEGGPIGIPITVVSASRTPKYRPSFEYADESDRGPYPIPANVKIEGGRGSDGDRHALIVDREACRLYELYALYPAGRGWRAGSGALWSLRSNRLRPEGWTSADAAGLPIVPGLARYDEVARGRIDHALRFTAERTRRAYVYPARHHASDSDDPNLPPMGLRLRLKAGFDTRGFPPQARVVLEALKRYGMMLADNGSDWFVSGEPHPRWNNDDLRSLKRVLGRNFEVVDTRSLRPHGAQAREAAAGAIAVARGGRSSGIYLVDVGSGRARRLSAGRDKQPAWSRDGSRIAFVRQSGSVGETTNEIYVVPARGGVARRVARVARGGTSPAWSPDGKRLAFSSFFGIVVTDVDSGRKVTEIPTLPSFAGELEWLPDGSGFVFADANLVGGIYRVGINGGSPARLIPDRSPKKAVWRDLSPTLDRRGQRILFVRNELFGAGDVDGIYLFDLEKRRTRQVTSGPADADPSWSPDGEWVAFSRPLATGTRGGVEQSREVFVVRLDGTTARRLTFNRVPDVGVAWRPT